MILLDTNVLSECMRLQPSETVIAWLDAQMSDRVWTCAISRAEIELGLALMPSGKRQRGLQEAAKDLFAQTFAGRCLPFEEHAASHYAHIVATRTRMGRPISVEDAQIAAVARAHGMALATRNMADFEHIDGLSLLNPWVAAV